MAGAAGFSAAGKYPARFFEEFIRGFERAKNRRIHLREKHRNCLRARGARLHSGESRVPDGENGEICSDAPRPFSAKAF